MADFFTCGAGSHIGDKTIKVTAQPNPTTDWRQGTITVHNPQVGKTETIVVKQMPNDVIVIPVSDFLVISYEWSDALDGLDYDSCTAFVNTGQALLQNKFIGWSKQMGNSVSNVGMYAQWSGDNQFSGQEGVLIRMKDLLNDFPSLPKNIEVDILGNWYEKRISGNVVVRFRAFLGGSMSLANYTFSNSGGSLVFEGSKQVNVAATGNSNWTDFRALYSHVAKFVYDKENKDGYIQIL